MAKVSEARRFDAPASAIWSRIGDFHGLPSWHPGITESKSLDGGIVRALSLTDGGTVVETQLDSGDLHYTYRIDSSPLPVSDYVATLRARDDPQGCLVEWEASFLPVNVPESEALVLISGIFRRGLDSL